MQVHGQLLAAQLPQFRIGLHDIDHPALVVHEVEIQLVGQPLIERHRFHVERNALVAQVVGADGNGVASDIAAAEPASLQDGNLLLPVIPGQVIGGGQPMSTGPDDQRIIVAGQRMTAPERTPASMSVERMPCQGKK